MEPITSVIAAALSSGLSAVGKNVATDAYTALKDKLKSLVGGDSEPINALEKLEGRPDSEARQLMLNEELVESKVLENPELQALVSALSNRLSESDSGRSALSQFNINAEKVGVVANTVEHIEQKF